MTDEPDTKRIDLKTSQVAAGSLASVTAAIAASQLGVAGTLIGAGVGGVVGTVATAVYEHYLDRTRQRVLAVMPRWRVRGDGRELEPVGAAPVMAEPALDEPDTAPFVLPEQTLESAPLVTQEDEEREPGGGRGQRVRRAAVALSAVMALAIGLLALTAFEAVTGRPVSQAGTDDGGTSIGQVFGGRDAGSATDPTPSPAPDESTSDEPTPEPTAPAETTPAPTTESPAPTESATPSPTQKPAVPTAPPAGG